MAASWQMAANVRMPPKVAKWSLQGDCESCNPFVKLAYAFIVKELRPGHQAGECGGELRIKISGPRQDAATSDVILDAIGKPSSPAARENCHG